MDIKRIGIWIGNKIAHSFLFGFLFLGGVGYFLIARYADQTVINHAEKRKIGFTHGGPVREAFLKAVVEEAKLRGIDYELIFTHGTEETEGLISDGQIDFGLVVGGMERNQSIQAREVMPIYIEALHLLVKNEIFKATSENFWNLKGRTINLGERLTGTHVVAWELLRFAGLIDTQEKMQFTPTYLSEDELVAAKDRRTLPDALFLLGGVPSATVRKMVANFGYQLVDLPFQEALTLDHFKHLASTGAVDGTQSYLNKQFVFEASIPAFTYGIQPPVPHAMLKTLGTRLIFIAHKAIDASAVKNLIEVVLSPNVSHLTNPPLRRDLLRTPFEYEPHPGVAQYLNADKQPTMNDIFGFFENVLQKWGIILGVYMLVQKLLQNAFKKKDTREKIEQYVREVMEIEKELTALQAGAVSAAQLAGLRARLDETRLKMMSAYVDENLKNPQQLDHALKAIQMVDRHLS